MDRPRSDGKMELTRRFPSRIVLLSSAFGTTVFSGALLLFLVEPLVCKALLPTYGGAPGVWAACMLTFQLLLFAGYVYADVVVRFLRPTVQAVIHVGLLAAAMTFSVLPSPTASGTGGEA